MVAFPASLILGIIGIMRDEAKWPGILATVLAGAIILYAFVVPLLC